MNNSKFRFTIISERFTNYFTLLVILIWWCFNLILFTKSTIHQVFITPITTFIFIFLTMGLFLYLNTSEKVIRTVSASNKKSF